MNWSDEMSTNYNRYQRGAIILAGLGLVVCIIGAILSLEQFFRSYLMAYFFWISLALGCLAVLMLHHLTGGRWGFAIRRPFEAGMMTLPLMLLLFLPLIFGLQILYAWAQPAAVAADPLLQHKTPYLNVPFFLVRAAIYFAIWVGLALAFSRWSRRQDDTGEVILTRRAQLLSGPGLIAYVLTVTFASIDWVMSLEAHWFSSIFGMLNITGQMLATIAFGIAILGVVVGNQMLANLLTPRLYNDLGNLLLAFVLMWAYIAFSQFLIIWSGNLPEEVTWYLHRTTGGWGWIVILLVLFYFTLPFIILLSRSVKQRIGILSVVALMIILMRLVEIYWMVVPSFYPFQLHFHWLDLAALVAIGGFWIAVFIYYFKNTAPVPRHDPRLQEAIEHGR
jgi:hypothetical protein